MIRGYLRYYLLAAHGLLARLQCCVFWETSFRIDYFFILNASINTLRNYTKTVDMFLEYKTTLYRAGYTK